MPGKPRSGAPLAQHRARTRRRSQMGRHASTPSRSGIAGRPALLGGLAVLLVAAIGLGLVWWRSGDDDTAAAADCSDRQTVRVTVAPEVGPLVEQLLSEPASLGGGAC